MNFKSFLQWIQNDKPDPKGNGPESKSDWNEKRRDNRIDLPQEKALVVHLMSVEVGSDKAKTLVANVRNVSVRGFGLVFSDPKDQERLALHQVLLASLAIEDFQIPLQVEVVRLMGDKEAAVKFKPPYPRELDRLEKFLEPRCLGRSLREIDPGKLQKNQQKGLRWFQGVNETHLFSWIDSGTGKVNQQQLVFLDRVIEWKEGGPVRTGLIRPDEKIVQGDMSWVRSELLDFDASPAVSVMNQAKVLLESASIDEQIKQAFLKKI